MVVLLRKKRKSKKTKKDIDNIIGKFSAFLFLIKFLFIIDYIEKMC